MAVCTSSGNSSDITIDPLHICKICISSYDIGDMYEVSTCKCLFCLPCIKLYLNINITEGNCDKLTCPDAFCPKVGCFTDTEIEKVVERSVYDRFCRFKFEREVDLDPNRTWCPEAGCETVCSIISDQPNKQCSVTCPKCKLEFCSQCKNNWHGSKTCDSNMKSRKGSGIPFKFDGNTLIKRCPECHIPIERADGCAQMMCKKCHHIFCWYCLTSLEDDLLLRHYDRGPCKDKLGHSRASIIWRRTQIVVVCAGFGVLLIIASPFLFLAAPCILCCKCSSNKNKETQEDTTTAT